MFFHSKAVLLESSIKEREEDHALVSSATLFAHTCRACHLFWFANGLLDPEPRVVT